MMSSADSPVISEVRQCCWDYRERTVEETATVSIFRSLKWCCCCCLVENHEVLKKNAIVSASIERKFDCFSCCTTDCCTDCSCCVGQVYVTLTSGDTFTLKVKKSNVKPVLKRFEKIMSLPNGAGGGAPVPLVIRGDQVTVIPQQQQQQQPQWIPQQQQQQSQWIPQQQQQQQQMGSPVSLEMASSMLQTASSMVQTTSPKVEAEIPDAECAEEDECAEDI